MDQVAQVIGAILILLGFVLSQLNLLSVHAVSYLVLNLVGASLLAWLAWHGAQWGFLMLEVVWATASAISLIAKISGVSRKPRPTNE